MAKYSKKIVEEICSLVKADSYTIAEICKMVGISKSGYYKWLEDKVEFLDAIKKAEDEFRQDMLVECKRSLRKLITGYTAQERHTIMVDSKEIDEKTGKPKPKIKEQKVVEKCFQPNLGAIIHFQTNQDPDNWKNKHSTEVTGKDGKDLIPARILTKKEVAEYLKQLEDEC